MEEWTRREATGQSGAGGSVAATSLVDPEGHVHPACRPPFLHVAAARVRPGRAWAAARGAPGPGQQEPDAARVRPWQGLLAFVPHVAMLFSLQLPLAPVTVGLPDAAVSQYIIH